MTINSFILIVESLGCFCYFAITKKKMNICMSICKHFSREFSLKKNCQVIGMIFIYLLVYLVMPNCFLMFLLFPNIL